MPVSIDTTKASGRRRRARRRRHDRQRRVGRHGRPRHARGRRRRRRGARADAHARRAAHDAAPKPHYDDVVARGRRRAARAGRRRVAAGVARRRDPRRSRHRLRQDRRRTTSSCSRALAELAARVEVPLVVGASRKSFLGACSATRRSTRATRRRSRPRCGRFTHGARVVRVHDVARSARAVAAARRNGSRDASRDGG